MGKTEAVGKDLRSDAIARFAYLAHLLYATIVLACLFSGPLAFTLLHPLAALFPLTVGIFAVFRYLAWRRADTSAMSPTEIASRSRWIALSSVSIAAAFGLFLTVLISVADGSSNLLIAFWACILGLACSFCLNGFQSVSRFVLYLLVVPPGAAIMLSGASADRGVGLTMLVLAGILHLAMNAVNRLLADMRAQGDREGRLMAATQRALEDFLSVSQDYNFETDEEGRLVYASANFEAVTGVPAETLKGMPFVKLSGNRTPDGIAASRQFERCLAAREPVHDLYATGVLGEGRTIHTLTNAAPVFDDLGMFRGYRGWIVDVTEQKQAQADLAANEARFRDFATLAADCLWETDAEGCYTYVSDIVTEWSGRPVERFIGKPRRGHFDEGGASEFSDTGTEQRAQIARREPFSGHLMPTRAGRILSSDGVPRFSADGAFLGYRGCTRDVTREYEAQKAAEKARAALEASNRRLERRIEERTADLRRRTELLWEVIDTMSQGLIVVDREGRVELMNDKAAAALPGAIWALGVPFEETYEAGLATGDGGETFQRETGGASWAEVRAARDRPAEHYRRTRDRAYRESYTPMAGGGRVATISDITEDIERQDELRALKDAAEAASRAKSEFLANMSHEIRTPMNGVLGMAELLDGTELTTRQADMVAVIRRSGDSLLGIINDVLDFSKLEAGKMTMAAEPFDVRAAVEDVATLVAPAAHGRGVEVVLSVRSDTPRHVVGDVGRFRQVMTNLVGNAVKFTEAGQVLIGLCGEQGAGEVALRVRVEDTGCGVPPEELDRIFRAFEQVDGSASRRFEGTGLGLSISRRIAQLMGGAISATSAPGEGSTFTFSVTLPLAETEQGLARRPMSELDVLVADANRDVRAALREQLEAWGARVDEAGSAEALSDALSARAAAGGAYALVLRDEKLAEHAGGVSERPASTGGHPSCPHVLMSTSEAVPTGEVQASGTVVPLAKPIRLERLEDAVATALGDRVRAVASRAGRARRADPASETARFTGVRLLVAEDNAVNRMVVQAMLADSGFEIAFAENGEEALRLFAEATPDAVLMDVSMPVMDGLTATRAIRASGTAGRDVPIIGVTAHALAEDEAKCRAAGMSDYLSKPINKAALLDKLAACVPTALAVTEGGPRRSSAA